MASSSRKGKRKDNPCLNNEHCYYGDNNRSSNTFLASFPPGFKFAPTDQELILCYLSVKVQNKELPPNLMHDIDLYLPDESLNPEQLSARYVPQGKGEWYFFTPRDKKYKNGHRPNRASGGGYWKASSKDTEVESNGKLIGYRKSLVFYKGKPPKGKKTNWIMHEFRLVNNVVTNPPPRLDQGENHHTNSPLQLEQDENSSKRYKLNDWVLFRIHYNTKGAKQAKQEAIPEANIPAQVPGIPTDDPHLRLEDVKVTIDNPMTFPGNYNVNFQNGQSNAYSTPEDFKITFDNTMPIPIQFADYHPSYTHHPYQSEFLAGGPSNAKFVPEDNAIITTPAQFTGQPTETNSALLWGSNQPVFENTAGSANPYLFDQFEFGGENDFNLPMSGRELLDGMELLDFKADFDDSFFDDLITFDDKSLANGIVS